MKQYLLPTVLAAFLFASCSSAYKSGQTPDDVYYSPTRFVKEEEKKEEQKDSANSEDRYLRMKVRNYNRWSTIDDYTYWNDTRYDYQCNCTCNNGFYTTSNWGNWHYTNFWQTPFYYNPIKQPIRYTGNTSGTNILAYKNKTYTNDNTSYNPKLGSSTSSGNGFGSLVKKAFSTKNGTTTSWDTPARSFGSSSSSSSSSSSGTSSSAGGRSGGFSSKGSTPRSGRN